MTPFPTPFTVGVKTFEAGAVDDMGVPSESWSAPVETAVYGWSPPGTRGQSASEPFLVGREAVTWDLDLLVPPGFSCGPKDRVVVPGYSTEFEVEGLVEDYNFGPFGFKPGGRVRLRIVEG